MGVVGCYHLGRRKRTEKFQLKVVGEVSQVTVKSHWQEPAVFSLTLERLSMTFTANGKRETAGSCLS